MIIEMLLAVTILLLCTMAIVQWTFTTYAVQAVNSAATEGARTAAGVFANSTDRNTRVRSAVLNVLSPLGFQATGLTVTVVDSTTYFTVTVKIPVTSCPIPQLLNSFGFTAITGKSLNSSGVAWAT
ncbi:MAG: TadE family protein [Planctomycetota bacterium]